MLKINTRFTHTEPDKEHEYLHDEWRKLWKEKTFKSIMQLLYIMIKLRNNWIPIDFDVKWNDDMIDDT